MFERVPAESVPAASSIGGEGVTTTTTPPNAPGAREGRRRASGGLGKVKVRRLRLGGQVVMTVGNLDEIAGVSTTTSTNTTSGLSIGWPAILALAGFDCDESAVLLAGVHGVTRIELAGHLGWDNRKAEAVRKRARRRLRNLEVKLDLPTVLKADPSKTAILLRFPHGGLIWEHRSV